MGKNSAYIPALVLLAGCGLLARTRAQRGLPLAAPLATVLPQYHGLRVENVTLSAEEQRVAGMTSYIARAYMTDTTVVFTSLVSYYDRQTQGRTIHSPRNCLPGAGWEVVRAGRRTFRIGN